MSNHVFSLGLCILDYQLGPLRGLSEGHWVGLGDPFEGGLCYACVVWWGTSVDLCSLLEYPQRWQTYLLSDGKRQKSGRGFICSCNWKVYGQILSSGTAGSRCPQTSSYALHLWAPLPFQGLLLRRGLWRIGHMGYKTLQAFILSV